MTSSHENEVKIKCDTIRSITYINGSFAITDGQPSSLPPSISQDGSTWTLKVDCGRKGSSSVAGQFTNISGGVGHVYSPEAISDASPTDLNFYFGVTLGIETKGITNYLTVYFGQGHRALRNNWWIGSPDVAKGSKPILTVLGTPDGETRQVYTISGGVSDFQLSPWLS